MTADSRLRELGLTLPEIPRLPGKAQPRVAPLLVHKDLGFLSGIGPIGTVGRLGDDFTLEDGYAAARATALLAFRRIVDALGELDRVARWIRVLGFVRSAPGFGDQPAVMNGFSDLVIEVFGDERGRSARSAIGVSELPANIPVEIEAVLEVRP